MIYIPTLISIIEVLLVTVPVLLAVVYIQLVEGKATTGYPWLTPQLYSDTLQTLLNRSYNSLEWALTSPPRPHAFVSLPLQSSDDLSSIVTSIDQMLPQLADFIKQFNTLVNTSNINVITDAEGNLSIDVAGNMSDIQAQLIQKKISIIDRLINTQGSSINDQFQKASIIENKLKLADPNYSSIIQEQVSKFKALNASYKH